MGTEKSKKRNSNGKQTSSTIIQTESEISSSNKLSTVLSSPSGGTSTNLLTKIDKLSTEIQSQRTPAKFGIVFTSQDRHSTITIPRPAPSSSSIRIHSQRITTKPRHNMTYKNINSYAMIKSYPFNNGELDT
ncbi:unnamed protein product [Rotaria sordida]|uniref:Uncharacterized protein n=1 Tax=Rotaria sordida TaxID=392033 RepID=A0A814ARJ4_9BILA|nr:unnamed protein product [Rotaria sordida]CAF0907189.1 unnamed protein product [Rotaria sordida]CAF0919140.1 unnamed protein product [Rotaria sordida]